MSSLVFLPAALCWWALKFFLNNNNYDNVYGAIIMTKVIARVHPVHLMNVDRASGGRQPSDQANRLGLESAVHHPPSPLLLLLSP